MPQSFAADPVSMLTSAGVVVIAVRCNAAQRAGNWMSSLLVNIDVDDLGRAIAFYRDAFGLRVGRRFGEVGVEMLGTSSAIYLLVKRAGTAATRRSSAQRDYTRHWTPVHLDFVVNDIHAAVNRAQAAGAMLENDVETYAWGHIAHCADPFGHGFCLIEFRGRGYDEICDAPSA